MRQITHLILGLIHLGFIYPQNLPRFLRGDEVCCMDRDKYDLNWETYPVYANPYFHCGDVVVSFLDDIYWIDFDGKNDQPWHRSLIGNSAGGTDICVQKREFDQNHFWFTNPRSSWFTADGTLPFNQRISDPFKRRGYAKRDRIERLGSSDYDISNCEDNYAIKKINGEWATTLQECHETAVSDGNAAEFGNFADCWDECKEREHVCKYCDNLDENFRYSGDETCTGWKPCYHRYFSPGKLCYSKCGSQGVCCRHGKENDRGYCEESVSVDSDVFNHNMDMGTYNHHGCVPKPRDPKTCKCEPIPVNYFVLSNFLARPCVTCSEGYTYYLNGQLSDNGCQENVVCDRCPQNEYPKTPGAPCTTCDVIETEKAPSCSAGKIWVDCSNTFMGRCETCDAGTYTDLRPGKDRTKCHSCTERENECEGLNAKLDSCPPEGGKCVCLPGFEPTDLTTDISIDNPCKVCDDGTFKPTTANTECERCTTFANEEDMDSAMPRTTHTDCNCGSKLNKKHFFNPSSGIGDRSCKACKLFPNGHLQPFKLIDETECRPCPDLHWFNTYVNPENCTLIPIMELKCQDMGNFGLWNVEPLFDSHAHPLVNFKFKNGNPVPPGSYLDINSRGVRYCNDQCSNYQYSHLCGRPESSQIYVKDTSNAITIKTLNNDVCTPELIQNYKIVREGMCIPCTGCTDSQYNKGCELNNPGTCTACSTQSDCSTSQYLYHNKTMGCADPEATTDYECRDCLKVEEANQEYFIVESCGGHSYTRWDPDSTDVTALECSGSADSHCKFDVVESVPRERHRGTRIPYCPPEYIVDKTCFDRADNANTWNAECCLKCSEDNPEKKKSSSYQKCTGSSTIDTQRWVDRCENNYYEDQNENVCKPCETCS